MRDGVHVSATVAERAFSQKSDATRWEDWGGFESVGNYRIHISEQNQAVLEWNNSAVKLVAIDGQHRLFALQQLWSEAERDPNDADVAAIDFLRWQIPAILIVDAKNPRQTHQISLLEKVRDIFVTINKEAKKPTRSRTILLNDYSISSICCQEILDHCHDRPNEAIPLPFFDWRAANDQETTEHYAAFLRVEELEDLHLKYLIFGREREQDLSDIQKPLFFVSQMRPALNENDKAKMREQIRKRYKETVMPGVLELFRGFLPYGTYVQTLRRLVTPGRTAESKFAVSQLIFGKHHSPEQLRPNVDAAERSLRDACKSAQSKIPEPFNRLVGVRGLACGFGRFRSSYWAEIKKETWETLAKKYVKSLNSAFQAGLLHERKLRHLVYDSDGGVVHYRHDAVTPALGAYCALIAASKETGLRTNGAAMTPLLSDLERTLRKGYRKEVKIQISDKNPRAKKERLNELIAAETDRATRRRLNQIRQDLGLRFKWPAPADEGDV
jgi:hypothetical protein